MNSSLDLIDSISNLLYEKIEVCNYGIEESRLAEMISIATERYPMKKIKAVKNWMIWDFIVSQSALSELQAQGVTPTILYAHNKFWDDGALVTGCGVKTTALISIERDCLFVTRNSVYVLVGIGYRKTVDPTIAAMIRF